MTHPIDKSSHIHAGMLGDLAVPLGHTHRNLDPLNTTEWFKLIQVSSDLPTLLQHLECLFPIGHFAASTDGLEEGPHNLVVQALVFRL